MSNIADYSVQNLFHYLIILEDWRDNTANTYSLFIQNVIKRSGTTIIFFL